MDEQKKRFKTSEDPNNENVDKELHKLKELSKSRIDGIKKIIKHINNENTK